MDIPNNSEWQPITRKVDLAILGKLGEELSEATTAIFRCIIQGMNEAEPTTGKVNRDRLAEELADVDALMMHCVEHFNLDASEMALRSARKYLYKKPWFDSLKAEEQT